MALIDAIKNVGRNSTIILGRHPDVVTGDGGAWTGKPTDSVGSSSHRNIYPFLSEEIGVEIENVEPNLNTGDPGPRKSIQGQQGLTGPVQFGMGEDQLGEILRWITGSDNQPSTADSTRQITGGVIIAASTTVTVGTAQTPASGKQPEDLVKEPTSYAVPGTKILGPCQVAQIKVTVTGTIGSGKKGIIRIKGTDQYDRQLEEDIDFSSDYNTAKTSDYFYKTVDSVVLMNATSVSTDALPTSGLTWKVEAVPDNYKYEFKMTSKRTPFYGMEVNYGGDDIITFLGLVVNQVTMNFGELIGMTMDVMGREARVGENLIGGNQKTDISGSEWKRPKGNLMTNMGVELWADGKQFFCSALEFSMNQNYAFPDTSYGARTVFRREPAHSTTPRSLSCGFTIDHRQSDGFDVKSFGDDIPVRLIYSTVPLGGNHASIEFNMPQCAFAEPAIPGIPDGGPVYRAVSLSPYATSPGNELTIYRPERTTEGGILLIVVELRINEALQTGAVS